MSDDSRKKIAAQMNLSETAFVTPAKSATDVASTVGQKRAADGSVWSSDGVDSFKNASHFNLRFVFISNPVITISTYYPPR